jgi:hypothetical protein
MDVNTHIICIMYSKAAFPTKELGKDARYIGRCIDLHVMQKVQIFLFVMNIILNFCCQVTCTFSKNVWEPPTCTIVVGCPCLGHGLLIPYPGSRTQTNVLSLFTFNLPSSTEWSSFNCKSPLLTIMFISTLTLGEVTDSLQVLPPQKFTLHHCLGG